MKGSESIKKEDIKNIFLLNKDNLFEKIFGSETDSDGNKYSYVYSYEINKLSNTFVDFVTAIQKYKLKMNIETMYAWLVHDLDEAFHELDATGCYLLAYDLVKELNQR